MVWSLLIKGIVIAWNPLTRERVMRVSAHSHTFHCITENIFRYYYQLVIFLRTTISSVIQWQFWKTTYGLVTNPWGGMDCPFICACVCAGTNLDKMIVLKVDNSNKWSLAQEVCVDTKKSENQIKCVTISKNKLVS